MSASRDELKRGLCDSPCDQRFIRAPGSAVGPEKGLALGEGEAKGKQWKEKLPDPFRSAASEQTTGF